MGHRGYGGTVMGLIQWLMLEGDLLVVLQAVAWESVMSTATE